MDDAKPPELYFSPQPTRSARARWAFLEAGRPFEPHPVDVFAGEHKQPAYTAMSPLSQVPVARFAGESVTESAALALIACTGSGDLVPQTGTAQWRAALQWVVHAPAELDHHLATLNQHRLFLPPPQRDAAVVAQVTEAWNTRVARIEAALGSQRYLLGDTFTVADICIGHSVVWGRMHDLIAPGSTLAAYLQRLQERPSFVEVYGPEVDVFPDPHAA